MPLRQRPARADELEHVARMNVALQEDEGASVMSVEHALVRLGRLEALVSNPGGRALWEALGFREYSVRYERTAAITPHRGR